MPNSPRALADSISRAEAQAARERFAELARERGLVASDEAIDLAALLECAYPAMAHEIAARPKDVMDIARGGTRAARTDRAYKKLAAAEVGDPSDEHGVRRGLRRFAGRERMRIAARELLHHAGGDVDVTSRELAGLADACAEIALIHALGWAEGRFGVPLAAAGGRCPFVVIGMGKLGGRELNAGSDVDLLLFYETDEGSVMKDDAPVEQTLHEHFTRVTQRFTSILDDVTEDGLVWRVDLRLRPEGSRGPLVNALAAAERYYETWGRTWERAALVRARPVAGDLAFGSRLLAALAPFVWRRAVDPQIAAEMAALVERARAEAVGDVERDLKIGRGGIREAEFFVQSLQLVWGGRDPSVRSTNTLDALRRLRARGLVTDREGREMADCYLALRRLEHRVQFATGLQTHAMPEKDLTARIARSLGFAGAAELEREIGRARRIVTRRLGSLTAAHRGVERAAPPLDRFFAAIDAGDEPAVRALLPRGLGLLASPDLSRHLLSLARRPDFPLGATSRDRFPELAPVLIEALSDAADPEQATRQMAALFARLVTPSIYARALADDPRVVRRVASLFGASAFLGEAMVAHPELVDSLLFGRGVPTAESAVRAVEEEVGALPAEAAAEPDELVGALRRAKGRVTMEVGLADLGGDLGTRAATLVLSALADATLDHATRFALRERGMPENRGLAVIAMGKLGGREIGYGSDLDVFFVYESPGDTQADFIRTAQRVIRLVSTAHGDGPGYELDTRLRPSGNQGLLVVSLDAFAKYHQAAQDWERQALLKARACAGDAKLGERVLSIAHAAAYERGAPRPEPMHHLRMRVQRELAGERPEVSLKASRQPEGHAERSRYDLKLGRGGLVDVEFAVQWLQMKHGTDPRVRTTDTESAIEALESCGYLAADLATPLHEGYRVLRRLEQRLRVLHGTSASLIEAGAPGLAPLARRMGMRDSPRASAAEALLERYRAVTRDVRAAYLEVLGIRE
jgi:glutamate-ammonia-ligase adenylyltransferase